MSQAMYIRDMMEDPEQDFTVGLSEIANFYAERNVLITGSSGFLGRLVVERILRSCPNVKTLFLLVRTKKGKSPEERIKETFEDTVFDRLRRERPRFLRKVVLIKGDFMNVGLGLSSEDRELLRSTHIVIHSAATVRFNEKMRTAVVINVRGTKELLLLAKEMADLKAFVYISTAYSNCVLNVIEEKFYPPPIDSDKLISLLDILNDEALDHLTPVLLGKWPNTYTFTKAIAEDTIWRNCHGLPVCIVRPSIIMATSTEPIAGWINNVYGATGILVGAGMGLLRTAHCYKEMVADIIPADYVVASILAVAWNVAETQNLNENSADNMTIPEIDELPIYNVVSSCQKPITWDKLMKYSERHVADIASHTYLWYYCFTLNRNVYVHKLFIVFLHLIPAAVVDTLAWLSGQRPKLWAAYKKIHKFSSVLEYFMLQQWRFHNDNIVRLWTKMGPVDRSKFNLNMENLNWEDYCYSHVRGVRTYILMDPLETLPQGHAKYAKLRIAHYTVVVLVCGFLLWLLSMFLRLINFL